MIHVNVRRDRDSLDDYIVETCTEGGPWTRQYVCSRHLGEERDATRGVAEELARTFADGIEYATGVRPRTSSGGYAL